MSEKNIGKSNYDKQESHLTAQSEAFLKMLKKRGMVEDLDISDETVRKVQKDKKRTMYHNTLLMLQHYRDIVWALECFPAHVAEELDSPMHDLDALLSLVSSEIEMENLKLENRLRSIQRSRLLLDRVNEAITILKQKPENGKQMYHLIYQTFIIPEKLSHVDILYRLGISSRHYYRLRKQAISILSIRLWAAPAAELDSWLEVLAILEGADE